MKTKHASSKYVANSMVIFRVTPEEKNRLAEQAEIAGLSLSEYMRRRHFGGRPIVSQTDMIMVGELRRIGGLLKHNFETMRQANADVACFRKQEEALRMQISAIEKIGQTHCGR